MNRAEANDRRHETNDDESSNELKMSTNLPFVDCAQPQSTVGTESDESEATASSTAPFLAPTPSVAGSPDPDMIARDRRTAMRLHLMTGLLCAVVVLLSLAMSTSGGTRVHFPFIRAPLPELCTSKAILGWPCPGCGMTRAFISLGHGRWSDAWAYNPAAYLLFPLVAIQVPWRAVQWWRLKRHLSELPPFGLTSYGIVLLLLLLGQWVVNLVI